MDSVAVKSAEKDGMCCWVEGGEWKIFIYWKFNNSDSYIILLCS